ncbi:MAG: TlpA family protein disulfide reductase [Puniceicoccales bacterium]|jgi:thiol-disulfide isomerase/thioredoxin|nr:TlpA family protein disulfide reductase [Puniceicoccales bacterium]
MRKRSLFFFALAATSTLFAATDALSAATPAAESEQRADRRTEIRNLLYSTMGPPRIDVEAKFRRARELGATEQQIVEAKAFHFVVVGGKTADIQSFVPQLEKALEKWDASATLAFPTQTFGSAAVHVLRARVAIGAGNIAASREAFGNALWLEPDLIELVKKIHADDVLAKAKATGGVLDALDKAIATGNEAAIRKAFLTAIWTDFDVIIKPASEKIEVWRKSSVVVATAVPLDATFTHINGNVVSLRQLMDGKKAILFDFHASWCGPCMQLLPNLPKTAERLAPKGIVTAALNVENVEDAKKVQKRFNLTLPVLVEKTGELSRLLNVDSIPRLVLIDAAGRVLFNGHESEKEKFQAAVDKLSAR